MKCSEIQEQLSAYYDGELTDEMRDAVSSHVANCESCASQLAEFQSYSETFAQLPQPSAPATIWGNISNQLHGPESVASAVEIQDAVEPASRTWLTTGRVALAASVLLVVGIGFWMARPSNHSSHSTEFVTTMDHYLKTLASDPDGAEQFLLDKYDGRTIDPEHAVELVGYRPAVASGLPDQYTLSSTSVIKMPCCTCVKAVCKRRDGSTLVLFEHDDEDTEWFGERSSSMASCGDKECCLVDLDANIAATWKRGSRWVTAVGLRDTTELGELVAWLESNIDSAATSL